MAEGVMETAKILKLITEDRRLVILRLLANVSDYTLNSVVLTQALADQGHPASREAVKADLDFLEDLGLVAVKAPSGLTVAALTPRGKDVACGREAVRGVKIPEPGLDD
jgi:Fe2+ or Zn2+ uptake regulation protein